METTWNHGICERCWFSDDKYADRFPTQVTREPGDLTVDRCCFCWGYKVTRIYVRHDPTANLLLCGGRHE